MLPLLFLHTSEHFSFLAVSWASTQHSALQLFHTCSAHYMTSYSCSVLTHNRSWLPLVELSIMGATIQTLSSIPSPKGLADVDQDADISSNSYFGSMHAWCVERGKRRLVGCSLVNGTCLKTAVFLHHLHCQGHWFYNKEARESVVAVQWTCHLCWQACWPTLQRLQSPQDTHSRHPMLSSSLFL